MNPTAFFKMTYGLFVLTAKENGFDNGCIINTAIQVAENPIRVSISVIQQNKTCDMIKATGEFNLSALSEKAVFPTFQRFGMQSGRNVDKFADFEGAKRMDNGILIVTEGTNMYMTCKVTESFDLGTHMLFIAEVTDGDVLDDITPSCTYTYYQTSIKPQPAPVKKKAWVCSICGYVYEGDEVPDDFECPLCHHGKKDFVLMDPDAPAPEKPKAASASGKKTWICSVCGYVHEGDTPPEECPLCSEGPEKFKEQ